MVVIDDAIISGFIGEAVSRCVDFSWTKIKEAVKNRKNKHQNIEAQIYNVVINVLNQITYNRFENNQDKIYQATESLFIGYKGGKSDNIEAFRSCLQILGEDVNNEKYMEFRTLLYHELCKKDYEELYRQIRLLQQDEERDKTSRIEYNVNEVRQDVREIKQVFMSEKQANDINNTTIKRKFQNNKKQDYLKIWNSRLFLHIDNEKPPITLSDAFIMPSCRRLRFNRYIGFSDEDALDEIIDKFVKYDKSSTMLIAGVPGIGKSSITSWIANKYRRDDNFIILRFRDWDTEELEKGILKSIYGTLECKKNDLENKVLVLDGYDEMKLLHIQNKLLDNFFSDIKDFENLKCIITSRPAYLDSKDFQNVLVLDEFDIKRVEEFCRKITGKELESKKKIEMNLEVLGIPVILYMALMSNIDIAENPTKPEMYNHIFAEEGGIFDKFYDGQVEYGNGKQLMRIRPNIERYLKFLRDTAYIMFENDKLSLLLEECSIPVLEFEEKSVSILEFPIKHLFEKNKTDIEFIHKSIYEYFLSEHIFLSIVHENDIYDLAGTFGRLLIANKLSPEVLEFLKYKFKCQTNSELSDMILATFQIMLKDGMTFHTKKCYKNVINCEFMILSNMLEIIHLLDHTNLKFDDIYKYLKFGEGVDLNLSGMDLRKVDWNSIDLSNTKVKNINLGGVNLERLNLKGARFKEADLTEADFSGAKLFGAKFVESKLVGADFTRAKLNESDLTESDLTGVDLTKIKW